MHGEPAALLEELAPRGACRLSYLKGYRGPPVSLRLPVQQEPYELPGFPAFLDGLLPEGQQLEALLRQAKIDTADRLSQIVTVGADLVGAVTVEELSLEEGQ